MSVKGSFGLLSLIPLCFPVALYAGKLTVTITYTPSAISREEIMPEIPIKDHYHQIPVLSPEKVWEPEGYYAVLEGTDKGAPTDETAYLRGLSVNRNYFLLKTDGKLLLQNGESFSREFTVIDDTGTVTKEFVVKPNSTAPYAFMRTGTYTFIDNRNPTCKIYVKILGACLIFPVRGPSLRIDLPVLDPGTYSFKIYYAFRQIFQEDFSMVGDSVQDVSYRIVDREVFRSDSTTFTGSRILSRSPVSDRPGPANAPNAGTSQQQP